MREPSCAHPLTPNDDHMAHQLLFDKVIERALMLLKDSTSRQQLIQRLMDVSIAGLVKTHLPGDRLLDECTRAILVNGLDTSKLPCTLQRHLKNKELCLEDQTPVLNMKAIVHDPVCCQWLGCDELNRVVLCLLGYRFGTDIPKHIIPYVDCGGTSLFAHTFRLYAVMLGIPIWIFPRC